jgi:GNAT superfamily N-acetyltransferase
LASYSDQADLLALYDHDERFAATYPDLRREELGDIIRHVDTFGQSGIVIFSRLTAATAYGAIEGQIGYFQSIGQDFEWKAYSHDQPPDLLERLAGRGFELDETEAIMVLDARVVEPVSVAPIPVRKLDSPEQLGEVASIRYRVYGDTYRAATDRLAREMRSDSDDLSVYVAYVDEAPAACGWIRFSKTSAFASLWGGSTVPELRGHGLYTALLAARVKEARIRGWRYVTVDARQMSRPILEKHGFKVLTYATACTWSTHMTSLASLC